MWRKRGKNITRNSNNYFFNLFVITHVWCCPPMSALHLPSLAWKMLVQLAIPCQTWEKNLFDSESKGENQWQPDPMIVLPLESKPTHRPLGGRQSLLYWSHHCTTPNLKLVLIQKIKIKNCCLMLEFKFHFPDSSGRVQKDIYNKNGNPSYKYYYGSTPASE